MWGPLTRIRFPGPTRRQTTPESCEMTKTRKTFRSQWSYQHFVWDVRHSNPYFRSDESEEFLKILRETAKSRVKVIFEGEEFWRAQLGHDEEPVNVDGVEVDFSDPCPHPPKRMKPISDKARENRANPKGIPYLYCASDRNTAMAELRPWKGERVSLGQFVITRNLRVIDCINEGKRTFPYYYPFDPYCEPAPKKREHVVWVGIDSAFSRPVSISDDTADYLPSQIIAGLFKDAGYDGVKYRSSLGKDYNLALFNTEDAELTYCAIVETECIKYRFGEDEDAYWIQDDKQLTKEERDTEQYKKYKKQLRARDKKKNE